METDALAFRPARRDVGSDEQRTPRGENDHWCIHRLYALSLPFDQEAIQGLGAEWISAIGRYGSKSCTNPSVGRTASRLQVFLFDNIRFRLGPRERACDSEGNGDGNRCVLAPHARADCSAAAREVEIFQI